MFKGSNVHSPGVVSKPNAILVLSASDPATVEAMVSSPSATIGIESFWATRFSDSIVWPYPDLAASLICKTTAGKEETYTQVKTVACPGTPIMFDNWKTMACTKITFRIGNHDEKGGAAHPGRFAMDNLSIVWYTKTSQRQHDQLKA